MPHRARPPPPNPNPHSEQEAAKPTLILNGGGLPTGFILLQVKGCIGTDCDTADATIRRFAAPVVAKIAGGNRNAGKASVMTFDCSDSFWPDASAEEYLVYSWSLNRVGTADGDNPFESINLPEPINLPELTLPANFLRVALYSVTCSVTTSSAADTGVKAAAHSVQVTVETNEVPLVAVGTFDSATKYGAKSKIRLNSTVSLASEPDAVFTLKWSVLDSSGTPLDLASNLVTTTGASQPNLVVRENALQAGVTYTFKLSATYPGQNPGESTISIAVSTPPRGGKILVMPATGYELETKFTLSAPNWAGDGNLYYTYVAEFETGEKAVLGHGQKKTTLSGVILNKGNLKVNVVVADAFGAEGQTTTSLTVKAKAVTAAAADNLIAGAADLGKSGKVGDAVGKIGQVFKALYAKPDEAGETITISKEKKAEMKKAGLAVMKQAVNTMTPDKDSLKQVVDAGSSLAGEGSGTMDEELLDETINFMGDTVKLMEQVTTPPDADTSKKMMGTFGHVMDSTAASSSNSTGEAEAGSGPGRRLSEAGDRDGGSGSGEAPRSEKALQFETLRAGVGALGDATLKGALDGEEAVSVVSRYVQTSASRASGASLAGQNFGAAEGPTKLQLPTSLSAAGSVAVKIVVIKQSINTYGADSDVVPETAMVSIKMTDDSGGNVAKKGNGTIGQADPLVLLVPVSQMAAPKPCDTAGAISCADLDALGVCESRNATCNLRGDCVNNQCFCDVPYLGFNCSETIGCNYWDDTALAWSSEGCESKDVTEVNDCTEGGGAALASRGEVSSGEALPGAAAQSAACAYALRCECTHLTDFAGIAIPTSLDEVLAQLEPTITLPCPDGFFAPFHFMESPLLYSLIKGLTLMNLISIAFFRWRYKLRSQGKELPWIKSYRRIKKPVVRVVKRIVHCIIDKVPCRGHSKVAPGDDLQLKGPEGDWFYAVANKQLGPTTALRLYELRTDGKRSGVTDSVLVWCPRLAQWTPYKDALLDVTREVASALTSKRLKPTDRGALKAFKRKETKLAAMLVTEDGAQVDSQQIASAFKEIFGTPSPALRSAYPHIFPPPPRFDPKIGILSLKLPVPSNDNSEAPSPEKMMREVPSAPPSPPELTDPETSVPAGAPEAAPAAAPEAAPAAAPAEAAPDVASPIQSPSKSVAAEVDDGAPHFIAAQTSASIPVTVTSDSDVDKSIGTKAEVKAATHIEKFVRGHQARSQGVEVIKRSLSKGKSIADVSKAALEVQTKKKVIKRPMFPHY